MSYYYCIILSSLTAGSDLKLNFVSKGWRIIRSGFEVKARTVYGGRNFCSHTLSLAVTVICLHGKVLYFVPMFCIVSVTMPCRVGE